MIEGMHPRHLETDRPWPVPCPKLDAATQDQHVRHWDLGARGRCVASQLYRDNVGAGLSAL